MSNTTENNPESKASTSTPTPRAQKKKASPSKPRNPGLILAVIAVLISVIALAGTAYIGWQGLLIKTQVPETLAHIDQLDNQLSRQQGHVVETIKTVKSSREQVQAIDQKNDRLSERIDQLSTKIRGLEGNTRLDWHLAEIEYMLRLANQRLLMASDLKGARAMLASADDMLRDIDDFSLHNIRESLADDIAALNAVPAFDQEGIYLKLQALVDQVPALELFKVDQFKPDSEEVPPVNSPESDGGWQATALNILKKSWYNFTDLFRFTTNRDRPVQALLTPEQEAIIRQNLRLLLEQSKLALLAREQTVFLDCLTQAEQWLTRYFALGGAPVKALLTELDSLKTVNIDPEFPPINRALNTLKHYQYQKPLNKEMPEETPTTDSDSEIKAQNESVPVEKNAYNEGGSGTEDRVSPVSNKEVGGKHS